MLLRLTPPLEMTFEKIVSQIDRVFESIKVNASIVICSTSEDVVELTQILQSKCYPYIEYGSPQINEYCNKMIVTTVEEYNTKELWLWLGETTCVDCVFFQNEGVYNDCIETTLDVTQDAQRCFIFTMS
jgi:hypothetical protein